MANSSLRNYISTRDGGMLTDAVKHVAAGQGTNHDQNLCGRQTERRWMEDVQQAENR